MEFTCNGIQTRGILLTTTRTHQYRRNLCNIFSAVRSNFDGLTHIAAEIYIKLLQKYQMTSHGLIISIKLIVFNIHCRSCHENYLLFSPRNCTKTTSINSVHLSVVFTIFRLYTTLAFRTGFDQEVREKAHTHSSRYLLFSAIF